MAADGFFGALLAVAFSFGPIGGDGQAASQTFGSPLKAAPNLQIGCETEPALANDGGTGNFRLGPSGDASCTWRQAGVFGVASDPRFSSVPATGRITRISVRSGPNPAPLRFVILRQLNAAGFPGQCCWFVRQTQPVRPRPNAISTWNVDIPVERNTIDGVLAVDIVGVSAAAGTGSLPLHSNGRNNAFQSTEQGSVNAGFFYPALGARRDDSEGGGRREAGIPGVEVLMSWTWSPR